MKDNYWVEEASPKLSDCKKRKRRVGKRKIEFIGWGSRPLMEFLETIEKDTTNKLSRHEVVALINKYINDKRLTKPEKKKMVLCDERLFDLFGKKSVSRTKIHDMLEDHYAENHDDSSDDELLDSSEEEYHSEKKRNPTGQMKKVPETPKSCFASVIPENIKLVYLKRSLIQDFLKVPESFECKVLGSFVRMRCDPNDIYQKNRFQLHIVTGVEKVSEAGGAGSESRLRLANYSKDVPINLLSGDNFTEEEIEDVRERIKSGLLGRPTVVELELKAQMLHADITKHWIAKELSSLKRLIDRANEKGRRKELFEYIERRKQLTTPSEREKLLLNIPKVIAEDLEPEVVVDSSSSEKAEGSEGSPKSIPRGGSDVSSKGASGAPGSGNLVAPSQVIINDCHAPLRQNGGMVAGGIGDLTASSQVIINNSHAPMGRNGGAVSGDIADLTAPSQVVMNDSHAPEERNGDVVVGDIGDLLSPSRVIISDSHALKGRNGCIVGGGILVNNLNGHEHAHKTSKQGEETSKPIFVLLHILKFHSFSSPFLSIVHIIAEDQLVDLIQQGMRIPMVIDNGGIREAQDVNPGENIPHKRVEQPTEIIALSSDDDDDNDNASQTGGKGKEEAVWNYIDPHGRTQGPFALYLLKQWSDAKYFHSGFKVWRNGQSSDDAVLLVDVLSQNFPSESN